MCDACDRAAWLGLDDHRHGVLHGARLIPTCKEHTYIYIYIYIYIISNIIYEVYKYICLSGRYRSFHIACIGWLSGRDRSLPIDQRSRR